MTHRNLVYFKTVADLGSISKAAEKLYIAQPSLSQTIRRIEEDVGTPLFQRTSTGLVLTFAGERYYWTVSQILHLYDNFQNDITDMARLRSGRLNVGCTNPLGAFIMPYILPVFHQMYPKILLEITEDNTRNMEEKLRQGVVDLGVLHKHPENQGEDLYYHAELLFPFVIVTAPGSPLAGRCVEDPRYEFPLLDLKELEGEEFIMGHRHQQAQQIAEGALRRAGILQPRRVLTVRNYDTIHHLAAAGMGIALLPREYIERYRKEGIPAVYFSIPVEYGACWNLCLATAKGITLTRAAGAFIELFQQRLENEFPFEREIWCGKEDALTKSDFLP